MASDRSRVSYDPSRQYRSVVAQQGRVTLEADVNEAAYIGQEELREETLDIVGPVGTPDDGFAVSGAAGLFDFHVGPGTLYVGGLRVFEPLGFDYSTQPEWLDHDGDPLWVEPKDVRERQGHELAALLLREQEVGAVEDRPLREVALGGPDSAQRTRLVRRVLRLATSADECEEADGEVAKQLVKAGVTWNPDTMRLTSPATLQVQFVQAPEPESPCDPEVQGGYLGADNQLIRVQLTGFDLRGRGRGRFVWGYNNSSFFYRVKAVDAQTLEFEASPIDAYHTPRPNKAVEVLRSAVPLGHDDYVAAHSGVVITPTAAFVPETRRLALPAPLPAEYVDPDHTTPLFLRVWEQELEFTSGTPVELPGTGLQVVIDLGGPAGLFTIGQFWTFAVRPRTPVNVYPQRYLDAAQPPEGPRLWLCPLAVIGWKSATFQLLDDCRPPFDDLVELTKRKGECCAVVVKETDVGAPGALQKLLDKAALDKKGLSLRPGVYELIEPLRLGPQHSGLVLEGCQSAAMIRVKAGAEAAFTDGLILLEKTDDFTLRGLRLRLPVVPTRGTAAKQAFSIGVRPVQSANLTIEDCLFRFAVDPRVPTVAIGVYGGAELWHLRLVRNRFLYEGERDGSERGPHVLVGFGLWPQAARKTDGTAASGALGMPLLSDAELAHNEFSGLDYAVWVRAVLGRVRCENNVVSRCGNGFQFAGPDVSSIGELVRQSFRTTFRDTAERDLHRALISAAQPEVVRRMEEAGRALPLPAGIEIHKAFAAAPLDQIRTKAVRAEAKTLLDRLRADLRSGSGGPAAPPAGAPPEAVDDEGEMDRRELASLLNSFRLAAAVFDGAPRLTPHLHFSHNEVLLESAARTERALEARSGIAVLLAPDDGGSVMLMGNRIDGRDVWVLASLILPAYCVVSGNLITNETTDDRTFSLVVHGADKALLSVMGNALRGRMQVLPERSTTAAPTTWRFLNENR